MSAVISFIFAYYSLKFISNNTLPLADMERYFPESEQLIAAMISHEDRSETD